MNEKKLDVSRLAREEPEELSEEQAEAVQGGAVDNFIYFDKKPAAPASKGGGEIMSSEEAF